MLRNSGLTNKRCIFCSIVIVGLMVLCWSQKGMATTSVNVGGKPATLMGYVNQSASFGIAGDHYDTKEGFQQAIFQLLVEGQLTLSPQLRFFGSVGLNADWAYLINENSNEWDEKEFDKSKHEMFIFDDGRDILHELHATWTPDNFFVRAGKQIVVWGETDGFRLMDQINPLDQRRGLSDVEFETTVLPIWLLRLEYYLVPKVSWVQDMGLEFDFNPNIEFRGDEFIRPGTEEFGIWAPAVDIALPPPFGKAHLGAVRYDLDEPDGFMEDDGFEYGLRLKSVIWDTIVTLNGFYGRDNIPATKAKAVPPQMEVSEYDGALVIAPTLEGYYPLMRFLGFTLSRDLPWLYVSALGGVAPVIRMEAFYAFDDTFTTASNTFEEHDEIRYAIGVDWKAWIRAINKRAAFMISPQFYHRIVRDYGEGDLTQNGTLVRDDNYQASLMITTSYFHQKIVPMFFWLRDVSEQANFFKIQVAYDRNDVWSYTVGVLLFNGEKKGTGFEPLHNKDQLYLTASYRF